MRCDGWLDLTFQSTCDGQHVESEGTGCRTTDTKLKFYEVIISTMIVIGCS